MVSGGVVAGFVLYVATKVVSDLGGAGFLSTSVAGWCARRRRLLVWRICAASTRGWLMGFAVSFSFKSIPRRTARAGLLALAVAWLTLASLIVGPAAAQTQPANPSPTQAKPQDKLVIDADELVYDKDKNTVTAQGSVQLFYQGRVLQADKVIYERAAKRVYAEGHAKMTDEHGDVVYGSRSSSATIFATDSSTASRRLPPTRRASARRASNVRTATSP